MSWQVVRDHIDKRLGAHLIHLRESVTGAEHQVQILIGYDACPTCGHVTPKNNLGEIDPKAIRRQETAALEASHAEMDAYARKNGIPVKKA